MMPRHAYYLFHNAHVKDLFQTNVARWGTEIGEKKYALDPTCRHHCESYTNVPKHCINDEKRINDRKYSLDF